LFKSANQMLRKRRLRLFQGGGGNKKPLLRRAREREQEEAVEVQQKLNKAFKTTTIIRGKKARSTPSGGTQIHADERFQGKGKG